MNKKYMFYISIGVGVIGLLLTIACVFINTYAKQMGLWYAFPVSFTGWVIALVSICFSFFGCCYSLEKL